MAQYYKRMKKLRYNLKTIALSWKTAYLRRCQNFIGEKKAEFLKLSFFTRKTIFSMEP